MKGSPRAAFFVLIPTMATIDESLRGRIAYDGTSTPLKTALFLVVCLAWLVPGLVGHDPWKYDEAIVFGIVNEMLRSGDWVTFRIAGEPYLEKAPLFLWVAACFAKMFGRPHAAVRRGAPRRGLLHGRRRWPRSRRRASS